MHVRSLRNFLPQALAYEERAKRELQLVEIARSGATTYIQVRRVRHVVIMDAAS